MVESDLEFSKDTELSSPFEERKLRVDAAGMSPLEEAILKTIAYGDIFDYPLSKTEIYAI